MLTRFTWFLPFLIFLKAWNEWWNKLTFWDHLSKQSLANLGLEKSVLKSLITITIITFKKKSPDERSQEFHLLWFIELNLQELIQIMSTMHIVRPNLVSNEEFRTLNNPILNEIAISPLKFSEMITKMLCLHVYCGLV